MENAHLEAGEESARQTASFLAHSEVDALITGPISTPIYECPRAARIRTRMGPAGKFRKRWRGT